MSRGSVHGSGRWIASSEIMSDIETVQRNGFRSPNAMCFLAGVAAGIVATVLLTPASGAATRALIGRKSKEGKDWIKATAAEAESRIRAGSKEFVDRAKEVSDVISRS